MITMATCRNCGETGLLKSDICGDYCVHCLDLDSDKEDTDNGNENL